MAANLPISTADKVLASIISLPPSPHIVYAQFIPIPSSLIASSTQVIESARKAVLEKEQNASILNSFLPHAQIGRESTLWVFKISAGKLLDSNRNAINDMQFGGLHVSEVTSFTIEDLYTCSVNCVPLRTPCSTCLASPSTRYTRASLQRPYNAFIDAVRTRLINDISLEGQGRARRLKGGFLLLGKDLKDEQWEWSSEWKNGKVIRPLIYVHLLIDLSAKRITIHPVLKSTTLISLTSLLSSPSTTPSNTPLCTASTSKTLETTPISPQYGPNPGTNSPSTHTLAPGMPIILLPYGTPAYFLRIYAGPRRVLDQLFRDYALGQGLGLACDHDLHDESRCDNNANRSRYIMAWIHVQNKQGEDKGVTVVWPDILSAGFAPSAQRISIDNIIGDSHARAWLTVLPDLPTTVGIPDSSTLNLNTTGVLAGLTTIATPETIWNSNSSSPATAIKRRRGALTGMVLGLGGVATEVGGYVDAVARERDRERERIRREKEGGTAKLESAPFLVAAQIQTAVAPVAAGQVQPAIQQIAQNPLPEEQFYPSPPQTNIPHNAVPPITINVSATAEIAPGSAVFVKEIRSEGEIYQNTKETKDTLPTTAIDAELPRQSVALEFSETGQSVNTFGQTDFIQHQVKANDFVDTRVVTGYPSNTTNFLEAPVVRNDFMDMDMSMDFGLDMGFGMGVGMSMSMDGITGAAGARLDGVLGTSRGVSTGGSTNTFGVGVGIGAGPEMDFDGAFTDDDFSFFDGPPRPTPATPAPITIPRRGSAASGPGISLSTPIAAAQPFAESGAQPSSWETDGVGLTFTPRYSDSMPPDLLLPSPGQTPESKCWPVTPMADVHVLEEATKGSAHGAELGGAGNEFDAIPFADSHKAADGKYMVGKFAMSLPSPPDEEDRTDVGCAATGSAPRRWNQYTAVTDPRIGVVRKLVGVKRKSSTDQEVRISEKRRSWESEYREWGSNSVSENHERCARMEADMEVDSDEEGKEDGEFSDSRPATPTPSSLPLGPTLLASQFQHSLLLPLCTPLRPPGAAVAATGITANSALASVPTPVSPAAMLGAASEKSKSLETAARAISREVVENSVWARVWRTNAGLEMVDAIDIWQGDVANVARLLESVEGLESTIDMKTLFALGAEEEQSQALQPPMIAVAKGDAVVQVMPSALRFWEKLGLGPRGGRKDLTAFVLYEDEKEERQEHVEVWLRALSATYVSKHLGSHVAGQSMACPRVGLLPLRFESFRKSLASFVGTILPSQSNIVIYVVTPIATMTLASPVLRQIVSAINRTTTSSEANIHFQLVPEDAVFLSMENRSTQQVTDMELICYSVYDRILQPVDRMVCPRLSDQDPVREYFQDLSFTLARRPNTVVNFVRQSPVRSLDVTERHTLFHVGYQITPCGKWVLVACVDQRGEAHDIGVWLTQGDDQEAHAVSLIWEFAIQLAKKASVEWRIVIARFGTMAINELDAWSTHLASAVSACSELTMMSVFVMSVEADLPWTIVATSAPAKSPASPMRSKVSSGSVFVDVSATTYSFHPLTRPTLSQMGTNSRDLGTYSSLIPESEEALPYENLGVLPLASTALIRVPANQGYTSCSMLHLHLLHICKSPHSSLNVSDEETLRNVTHNFYELSVLAAARWRLDVQPLLPLHLAAVAAMQVALDRGDMGDS